MINNVAWSIKYQNPDTSLPLIDRILKERGIKKEDLEKTYEDMHDPFLMNDMDLAVMKIDEALSRNMKTLIFGDYDVDGTTATKVLYSFLHDLGLNCDYYIPDRIEEGYGISMEGVDYILENEYELVITVDCGVTAIEQIEMLTNMGVDVIVTDHHECKDILPPAIAVIDCKRSDNTYPFKYLAGVGVALKLCQALCDEYELVDAWKKYTMFAAIGTVADVVPLRDENRIIVLEGLKDIKKTNDISIKNLLRISGKLENVNKLTASDIAFYIAPRINASSRIGVVHQVMTLFLTDDPEEAFEIAEQLEVLNTKRKETESAIFNEANKYLLDNYDFKSNKPIVVYGNNWHRGVIGIVASKLVNYYGKPTIVLSGNGQGEYHGSCRTFGDINMMNILNYASEHITTYGGHEGAAGLTVHQENLEGFINKVNEYGSMNFSIESLEKFEEAEMIISADDITLDNVKSLEILEPFGADNKELVFVCKDLKIRQMKKIGKKEGAEDAHLKATFVDRNNTLKSYDAIGFFMSDYYDVLPSGKNVDVLFSLSINEWQGKQTVQLMIKDIHFDMIFKEGTTIEESELFADDIITLDDIFEQSGVTLEELLPTREDYTETFSSLKYLFTRPNNEIILTDLNLLTIILSTRLQRELNPFKLDRILETINESGYIEYRKLLFDKIIIAPASPEKPKKKIVETIHYQKNHNLYQN